MPQHKSAEKRVRQTATRTARNRTLKSKLRTEVKKLRTSTSKEDAASRLRSVSSTLDRAARKGILHKRTAARQKSRLSGFVNKLQG